MTEDAHAGNLIDHGRRERRMIKNMNRRLFFTIAMLFATALAVLPSARAQGGQSFSNPQNNKGTCNPSAAAKSLAGEFLKKCQEEGQKDSAGCIASRVFAGVRDAVNSLAANGKFTIGARKIEFNRAQEGVLRSPGNRIFISGAPLPADATKVKVSLTKTGKGGAAAGVHICAIDPANPNSATALGSFHFNESRKVGDTEFMEVTGAQGKFLQVFLDGKSGFLDKLPLEFKAECATCK